MMSIAEIIRFLESLAPTALAEDWDNVGLLVGDAKRETASIMTCLTLTPDVVAEAVSKSAGLVVSHHPMLFRPVQQLTSDTVEGRMLLDLIGAGVAVYSPHTGYDSARDGINRQLSDMLALENVAPLRSVSPDDADHESGAGRFGDLPQATSLESLIDDVRRVLAVENLQYVGDPNASIGRLGIACGAAAEFRHDALAQGCQALLTGEARFHDCLEARSLGIALILPGHYATERPAMERMAEVLSKNFPTLDAWASEVESDPLRWV